MQTPTELWLIRHGQTDWNIEGRMQGQQDIPLNASGQRQAQQLSLELNQLNQNFCCIYSSDLQRASQTARCIGQQLNLPLRLDARLREICRGVMEGRLYKEIEKEFDFENAPIPRGSLHFRDEGGESTLEVAERMQAAANEIAQAHPGQKVLVVSHGFSLATLICKARSVPIENIFTQIPDNATQPVVISWPAG